MRPAPTRPAEPDDLAGADRERDVAEGPAAGQALDLEQHVADRGLDLREQRDRPADHVADEVGGGQLGGRARDDVPAVAEDRRAVAQLEHLVEPMADEQDRDAAVAQAADDREQPLDLVGGQRRGRLVEDQHARLDRERLGDLDQLLVRHRQAADRRADVEPDVELLEQRLRPARRIAPQSIGPQRPDGAWPMKTFSATVRSGNRRGSWWTTAIPSARAWAGPVDLTWLAVEPDRARCRAGGRRPGS